MTVGTITSLPSSQIKGAAFYIRANKVIGEARTPSTGQYAVQHADHPSWDANGTHGI